MRIGYVRVSTQEQNTIRQEVLMESLGVDEVYMDRMSGKSAERPELKKMMESGFIRICIDNAQWISYTYRKGVDGPWPVSI